MSIQPEPADLAAIEDRVKTLAYRLWEDDGCPDGRAPEHWARATDIVAAEMAKAGAKDTKAPPTWLQREPVADEKPLAVPDIAQSLEHLSRRIIGKTAA